MLTLVRRQRGRPHSPQRAWEFYFGECVWRERELGVYLEFVVVVPK